MKHFLKEKVINQKISKKGFTLVELLVVVTIIMILTTIGAVTYIQAGRKTRNARRQADLETVKQALVLYKADHGCYPQTNYEGIMNLLISGGSSGSSAYLNERIIDPRADQSYRYTFSGNCRGGTGAQTFTLQADLEPAGSGIITVKSP